MLTRKHYKEVAGILASAIEICRGCGDQKTVEFIINEIVDPISEMFYSDNYRFDYKRFEAACGATKEVL